MTALRILPSSTTGFLKGSLSIPPSKSLLHRGILCAALAGNASLCVCPPASICSTDIQATEHIAQILLDPSKTKEALVDCHESATTLRLALPLFAAKGLSAVFTGSGRLPNRPLAELVATLQQNGITITFQNPPHTLPLHLSGRLSGGTYSLPGNVSSQFVSGLLLALPLLPHDSSLTLTSPLESESYIDLTQEVQQHFGVSVSRTSSGFSIPGHQTYHASSSFRPEGDFSQAAFWLLANYLGHSIKLTGLPSHSKQGDQLFADYLTRLHCADASHPRVFDISQTPDLFPVLAAAAAVTPGTTHLVHAERLRFKECDRLHATAEILSTFGVQVHTSSDCLTVIGTSHLQGCTISCHHDHRMAMMATILATRANSPTTLLGAEAIQKSYPHFFEQFNSLGGAAHVFELGS